MKAEMKKSGGGAVTCYKPQQKKAKPVLTFKGGGAVTCYKPKKKQ